MIASHEGSHALRPKPSGSCPEEPFSSKTWRLKIGTTQTRVKFLGRSDLSCESWLA